MPVRSLMAGSVKVFGCRPQTEACRRAETRPAFENLQGREPRVRTGGYRRIGGHYDRAKARGVKMGRPLKLTPHQKKEAIKRRDQGEETLAEIGKSYNVSGWTIARLVMFESASSTGWRLPS